MSKKKIKFMKLPAKERRILLAKDVIKHLKSGLVRAEHTYLAFVKPNAWSNDEAKLDRVAKKHKCEVCALGALFIADIMIRDRVTIGDIARGVVPLLRKQLHKHFSDKQTMLIESAYEKGGYLKDLATQQAVMFGNNYVKDRNRMIGIMTNIIDNEGTFIP